MQMHAMLLQLYWELLQTGSGAFLHLVTCSFAAVSVVALATPGLISICDNHVNHFKFVKD